MWRYDDKNRYDERTRRDSSEKEKVEQDRGPRSKEREQPRPDVRTRQDSSDKERTSRGERRMTTDKLRLTRTPSDAVRMISDAIPVGEEQWTLVEMTSGSRKERRERAGDEREKEKERSREAEKERERGHRREKDRETADAMTSTPAYALTIIMVIALAAAKERNVTGQLSRELLKFLINPANLSIR